VVYRTTTTIPATASTIIKPVLTSVSLSTCGHGALQAISYPIVGPSGETAKAVYYKLVVPPKTLSVKFPNLPLGRLVLDVRKYNAKKIPGNYGYRQFMLAPSGNEFSVDEIANIVSTNDPVSIVF
jgi:hypothetical protein